MWSKLGLDSVSDPFAFRQGKPEIAITSFYYVQPPLKARILQSSREDDFADSFYSCYVEKKSCHCNMKATRATSLLKSQHSAGERLEIISLPFTGLCLMTSLWPQWTAHFALFSGWRWGCVFVCLVWLIHTQNPQCRKIFGEVNKKVSTALQRPLMSRIVCIHRVVGGYIYDSGVLRLKCVFRVSAGVRVHILKTQDA